MSDSRTWRVGVAGATGLVGREVLAVLDEGRLAGAELRLLASARSAGQILEVRGKKHEVEALSDETLEGLDVVIFAAGGDVSRRYCPAAVARGAVVIDNSSAFRMDDRVPLIVPEINGALLEHGPRPGTRTTAATPGIIANPNCSTIIALMALTPLHRAAGVRRMVVATYQAASGGGRSLLDELENQVEDHASGRPYRMSALERPYLFNVFSHNSTIGPDGYNAEETKLVRETRKIWNDDDVAVTATCVRVPVLRAHCEAINVTFREPLSEAEARELLLRAPGVRVIDDRAANRFPEPIDATGGDDVLVGRIRADRSQPPGAGLDLFVAGDQLRKGAALNAIQIAERLFAAAEQTGRRMPAPRYSALA